MNKYWHDILVEIGIWFEVWRNRRINEELALGNEIGKPIANPEKLQPGDWFVNESWPEADERPFYVMENKPNIKVVYASRPKWPASRPYGFLYSPDPDYDLVYGSVYLGRGKRKWYWRFLPWRDLIVPFTKPRTSVL